MARMPGAKWQGEHGSRAMTRYDIVCIHTIVGYAPAHAAHFSTKADGTILQSRDTKFRSAANLNGNHRVIAIENEDHGPRFGKWPSEDNAPPLTPEQVEANAQILAWAHKTHGIPLQLCPNSKPTSRGLAYHRQGIDGNFGNYDFPGRVNGGELWTEYDGKVCPTDNRIRQRPLILARAIQIVGGVSPSPEIPEDDDMPLYAVQKYGSSQYRLFTAGFPPISISQWDYNTLVASGVPEWRTVHGGKVISNDAVRILADRIPGLPDTANAVQAFRADGDQYSAYTMAKQTNENVKALMQSSRVSPVSVKETLTPAEEPEEGDDAK